MDEYPSLPLYKKNNKISNVGPEEWCTGGFRMSNPKPRIDKNVGTTTPVLEDVHKVEQIQSGSPSEDVEITSSKDMDKVEAVEDRIKQVINIRRKISKAEDTFYRAMARLDDQSEALVKEIGVLLTLEKSAKEMPHDVDKKLWTKASMLFSSGDKSDNNSYEIDNLSCEQLAKWLNTLFSNSRRY